MATAGFTDEETGALRASAWDELERLKLASVVPVILWVIGFFVIPFDIGEFNFFVWAVMTLLSLWFAFRVTYWTLKVQSKRWWLYIPTAWVPSFYFAVLTFREQSPFLSSEVMDGYIALFFDPYDGIHFGIFCLVELILEAGGRSLRKSVVAADA